LRGLIAKHRAKSLAINSVSVLLAIIAMSKVLV
jgi:hypothetical protein